MKKHLIAAAVAAAVAVPAAAQVTMYGSFDTGYGSSKVDVSDAGSANSALPKNQSTSGFNGVNSALTTTRLGVRGSEDIGGGLKASFNLEWEVAPGTGIMSTASAIRTSVVGLSGGFGSVNIGRQLTGIHGVVAGFNPVLAGSNMVGDIGYSSTVRLHNPNAALNADLVNVRAATTDVADAVRASNSVAYTTPTMSGLSARVDYAKDKANTDTSVATALTSISHEGLRIDYAMGAFRVAAGTHTVKSITTGATAQFKSQTNAIAASYKLGAMSFDAMMGDNKYSDSSAVAKGSKMSVYRVGFSMPVGANVTIAAQYGSGDVANDKAAANNVAKEADLTGYQLAAVYSLSKRTNLYAAYGNQKGKTTAGTNATTAVVLDDQVKRTQYNIGLRHSF